LQEVVVVGVPFNKYGDRMFVLQNIAVCVSDNARVDTRQRDVKIRAAENAIEMDRKKKSLVAKVKDIVNKYYDNQIKQFPDRETLLMISKLRFNKETITKDRFYHYDFPQELMSGTDGEIIKELITISGGSFTDENPYHRQAYFSTYEPSFWEEWSESENMLTKFSYTLANDVYVILQVFTDGYFGIIERTNELTGGKAFRNINGSTNYSPIDNLIDIAPLFISYGTSSAMKSIPLGLGYVSKLNAAQFSKLMSKMPQLSKSFLYKPKIRGTLNRWTNKAINYWDNQISNGIILFKVKSFRPKEDKHFSNDSIPDRNLIE
jgi:hypothetical protein